MKPLGVLVVCCALGATAAGAQVRDPDGPDGILRLDSIPEVVLRVDPVYADSARAAGLTGSVFVKALVGVDGAVHEVRIVRSVPGLDAAAAEAARRWKFKPHVSAGRPRAVWVGIPFKFPPSTGVPAQELALRPVRSSRERLGAFGTLVSADGDSVASARIRLERVRPPQLDAYAEYMSVGPLGAAIPEKESGAGLFRLGPSYRRLRVTVITCERSVLLAIDDMVIGRADSRAVTAEYRISPSGDTSMRDLWSALQRAPRVLGSDPSGPPIVWDSPTKFAWITRSDTLVFQQEADSLFQVTIRARVR